MTGKKLNKFPKYNLKKADDYTLGATGSLGSGVLISSAWGPGATEAGLSSANRSAVSSEASGWTDIGAMGTGSNRPLAKRPMPRVDRDPKKQKVSTEPVIGLMAEGKKTVPPTKPGAGKGLMVAPPGSQKKPPVLLREDPKYALEKITSIIGSEDYEDLGNHSTEAMGETGLFNIAQVSVRHH